ncbi:MAG TPA: hypothetical protein VGN32_13060 [Ktedonobacterales bacterium]|nr:hypothetical protein [Ktedonobacterales bacterium]
MPPLSQLPARVSDDGRIPGTWLWVTRGVWLMVAALVVGVFVAGLPVYFAALQTACASPARCLPNQLTADRLRALGTLGYAPWQYAAYVTTLDSISALGWSAMAALLFWRRSHDRAALFSALTLLTFGAARFANAPLALAAAIPTLALPIAGARFLGSACLSLFFYVFPDGRFVPWWTRWTALAWIAVQVPVFFFANTVFNVSGWSALLAALAFFGFAGSVAVAQVYRYVRVSTWAERRQTRWVVFGMVVALLGYLTLAFVVPLFVPTLTQSGTQAGLALTTGATVVMLMIPLTLGIAILRSHLFDIDVVINRTLVYGTLTATLALIYFGAVLGLAALVQLVAGQTFTGQFARSSLVLVASTLLIAALFQPLRRRIQITIDRRFYRQRYNAAQALRAFSASLRNEVDLRDLTAQLVEVVDTHMRPTHISLWLRPHATSDRRTADAPPPGAAQ